MRGVVPIDVLYSSVKKKPRNRFETELEHEANNAFSGHCTLPLRNAFLSFLLSKFNPFKTNLNEHRDLVLTEVPNRVYLSNPVDYRQFSNSL